MRNQIVLSDAELIHRLKNGAALYSQYADTDLLFLYRHSLNTPYECYEVHFGRRNFMHLTGIKSKTLSAIEFYQACLDGTIERKDCTPCHSAVNMYSKVSVLSNLMDLKRCKLYKIGEKDLVTKDNDFEMATGNSVGTIGYDMRITEMGSGMMNRNKLPMPTTLLNNPITAYCSQPEKIMFVLQKTPDEERYNKLFYEIKKDLFQSEKVLFPNYIKAMLE